jgi:hypothetical protein
MISQLFVVISQLVKTSQAQGQAQALAILQLKEQAQAQAQAQALAILQLKEQAQAQALAISQQGEYFAKFLAQFTALVRTSPQVIQDVQAVQVPQVPQDVQAAQEESSSRIPPLPSTRESSPNPPQVIIIKRYPVEVIHHVQIFNSGSTAAAISFICAADKTKMNDGESTR